MTEVRIERPTRFLRVAVDSALLVGLLLVTVGYSGATIAPELIANSVARTPANSSSIDLSVDPPSFWMPNGANVSLEAVWSVESPLCRAAPLWYQWSVVDGGNATGFLNITTGPSATFVADSFESGVVTVAVRSGIVLACGANETVLERTSGANLSITNSLSLSEIEVGPNPLLPGGTATLDGTVTGGEPPYRLDVTWGDGAHSTVSQVASGLFVIDHRFSAGEFVPYVIASDSAGRIVNASVAEAISVGTGLEVAIAPASYVAEVGVPAVFTGIVQSEPAGAVTLFDCSNATVGPAAGPPEVPNGTPFSCTFASSGRAEVLFGVYPPQPGGPSASVVLYENVVAPPQVSAEPVDPVAEAGGTALVQVSLSGGAPPFVLAWNLSGNRSAGTEVIRSEGDGVLTIPLGTAGEYAVGLLVSDSLGGVATSSAATLQVDPSLVANASGAGALLNSSANAEVGGTVISGCPPFSWWVVPSLAAMNASVGNGTLGNVGRFSWNGSYAREGNLWIAAGVADGCGVTWETGLVVPLIPSLSVEATAAPGPASVNETLVVNVSIQGGRAPFRVDLNASDNESWNRTLPADGTYRWPVSTTANGSIGIEVSVTDRLGRSVETSLTAIMVRSPDPTVPPPSTSPPPPPVETGPSGNSTGQSTINPTWVLAVLGLAGGGGLGMLFWRRRGREAHHDVPGPDPVATLKRIIEPAEGAERFTVELLAEEAGVPLPVVRSTIDRLVSEGAVRSESGADGEEVLSWSSEAGR